MKFVLTLYLFSFVDIQYPVPLATHVVPLQFDSYKECILHGYKSSHNTLQELYGDRIDLLSNGFKATTSDGGINGSGATYIYMAFAESPFVNSNSVPNNAR